MPPIVVLLALTVLSHTFDGTSRSMSAQRNDPNHVSSSVQDKQQNRRFPPRDDSGRDPSFARFRAALLTAASRGDVAAIRQAVADTVRIPESTVSAEEFLKQEGLRQGQPWAELYEALTLGAVATSDTAFIAPYLAAETALDADRVVMGRNVRLRDSPSQKGHVIRDLDYHAVQVLLDHTADFESRSINEASAWAHVRTDTGETGYVYVGLLRSRGEARFYFERVDGNWKLVAYGYSD